MRDSLETDFFSLPRPRVFGHRGFSGAFPENTLPSFLAADAAGAPYLELDVHRTRDGEVVVIHDDDLRRTANQEGLIAELDLADVLTADAGASFTIDEKSFPFRNRGVRIPTLREVFRRLPHQRFIVEIKQVSPGIAVATLAVIEECGMARRVLIASEHQAPLDEMRALAPGLPTNFSGLEVGRFMHSLAPDAEPYAPPGDALQIPPEHQGWQLVTPASVALAHRMGIEVHVWTVNEAAEMRAMLASGVDGIITNFPSRLLEVLRSI
jgi:glycerophosphoryl diester phosphodiesterase